MLWYYQIIKTRRAKDVIYFDPLSIYKTKKGGGVLKKIKENHKFTPDISLIICVNAIT